MAILRHRKSALPEVSGLPRPFAAFTERWLGKSASTSSAERTPLKQGLGNPLDACPMLRDKLVRRAAAIVKAGR